MRLLCVFLPLETVASDNSFELDQAENLKTRCSN